MWPWSLSTVSRHGLTCMRFALPRRQGPLHHVYCRTQTTKSAITTAPRNTTSTRPAPQHVLQSFLSPSNPSMPDAQIHTANTLRSLYVRTRARDLKLTPGTMSTLIQIFGTLSWDRPHPPPPYTHRLASRLEATPDRNYWSFVMQLVADKTRLRMGLTPSDHFWAMHARLYGLRRIQGDGQDVQKEKQQLLSQARIHYRRLEVLHAHPDVHIPYLQALLLCHQLALAVDILARLLIQHDTIHSRLADVIYTIILKHGADLSPSQKETLLSALRERFKSRKDSGKPGFFESLQIHTTANGREATKLKSIDVLDLADALHVALMGPISRPLIVFPGISYHLSRAWIVTQISEAFDPNSALSSRWDSLGLLAMYAASSTLRQESEGFAIQEENSNTKQLSVVFRLATMRKLTRNSTAFTSPEVKGELRHLTNEVWAAWTSIETAKPRFVMRAAMASFFHLAAVSTDPRLKHLCAQYCTSADLWVVPATYDEEALLQVQSLAVQYAVASVMCGSRWEEVVFTLSKIWLGSDWKDVVGNRTLQGLTRLDAVIAKDWLKSCRLYGVNLEADLICRLAVKLAKRGDLDSGLDALAQYNSITSSQKRDILGAIIHGFSIQRPMLSTATTIAISTALKDLPLESLIVLRSGIQNFICDLVLQSQHAHIATGLFQDLSLRREQPLFSLASDPIFCRRFLDALVRTRQFRDAYRILAILRENGNEPDSRKEKKLFHTLWSWLLRTLVLKGASHVARQVYNLRLPQWQNHPQGRHRRTARIYRAARFGSPRPSKVRTLALTRLALSTPPKSTTSTSAFHDALVSMRTFIRAQRYGAAEKLLARLASGDRLPQRAHTVLGNVLLEGISQKRVRRTKDKRLYLLVSTCLERLMMATPRTTTRTLSTEQPAATAVEEQQQQQQQAFVPDRVTANIVLKSLFKIPSIMDSDRIRELFNILVGEMGYPLPRNFYDANPAAQRASEGEEKGGAMGTEEYKRQFLHLSDTTRAPLALPPWMDKLSSTSVSWKRHARPLYKMIIKALYARRDVEGARMVIGVLKTLEVENRNRRAIRQARVT